MYLSIQANPYHLVEPSPWPLAASFALLTTTLSGVMSFQGYSYGGLFLSLGLFATVVSMLLWWRDVVAEGTYLGHHTLAVQKGLTIGVVLFIVSEILFFVSIFWGFFHSSLAPTVELGCLWPPAGIESINPFELPLLNTLLLLSSGATVTYAHHSLISGNRNGTLYGLLATLLFAVLFTGIQGYEYYNAPFTFADGAYGSTFYMSTGFHGLHVIIGSIFLTVALLRIVTYHLTDHHHVGFESAILYWRIMPYHKAT